MIIDNSSSSGTGMSLAPRFYPSQESDIKTVREYEIEQLINKLKHQHDMLNELTSLLQLNNNSKENKGVLHMNKFEKVSYEQFKKDLLKFYPDKTETEVSHIYDGIKLPKRATKGSAGYDFYAPIPIHLISGSTMIVPTGIKVNLDMDKVLVLAPRSGHGFKYRAQLDNTLGVIDSDYFFSDNEGHIMAKITCDAKNDYTLWSVEQGKAFMQGIILQYYTTVDDNTIEERNGGFGSTDKIS